MISFPENYKVLEETTKYKVVFLSEFSDALMVEYSRSLFRVHDTPLKCIVNIMRDINNQVVLRVDSTERKWKPEPTILIYNKRTKKYTVMSGVTCGEFTYNELKTKNPFCFKYYNLFLEKHTGHCDYQWATFTLGNLYTKLTEKDYDRINQLYIKYTNPIWGDRRRILISLMRGGNGTFFKKEDRIAFKAIIDGTYKSNKAAQHTDF